jgi:hypothetical protein
MQVGVLLHSHVFFEQLHSHVNIQFFMLFTHSKVLSFFKKKISVDDQISLNLARLILLVLKLTMIYKLVDDQN